jgi:hypothetical protein
MFKLKERPPEEEKWELVKAKDTYYNKEKYWKCYNCNILFEPNDDILYCKRLDEQQCPICKDSLSGGDKDYFESKYLLTPIKEETASYTLGKPDMPKKKWYQFWK